jgi:hypothetical protein
MRRAAWRSTGESRGKVGINARLLDGYAERDGRSLFEGRAVEVRLSGEFRLDCVNLFSLFANLAVSGTVRVLAGGEPVQ